MAPLLMLDRVMVCVSPTRPPARLGGASSDEDDERDRDPDETPETPLDEPEPPRVQEPPPEPEREGPYVVSAW